MQVLKDVEAVFDEDQTAGSVNGMADVRIVEAIFVEVSCGVCCAWIHEWLHRRGVCVADGFYSGVQHVPHSLRILF